MTHLSTIWLAAATFVFTISLGAFLVGAVLRAANAEWALPMRRIHEALAGVLPIGALAFAPIARSLHVRDFVALAIIVGFEEWLRAASLAESPRARAIASASLPIVSLATALFANDALSPLWSSDAYGLYVLVTSFSVGLAAVSMTSWRLAPRLGLTANHAAAVGKVSLVACSMWAYLAFSIYLLVWISDLPREIPFFLVRGRGVWGDVLVAIVCGRFIVPFVGFIPRAPKRHWAFVGAMGAFTIVMHVIECVWLVVPNASDKTSPFEIVAIVALVGVALAVVIVRFRRHEALPADPGVARALAYEGS